MKIEKRVVWPMKWRIQRFLLPRHRVDDQIEKLVLWRNTTGIVLVVVVHGSWNRDISGSLGDAALSAMTTPFVIAGLVIVSALGMAAAARRGHRRAMLTCTWIPVRTVLVSLGALITMILLPTFTGWVSTSLPADVPGMIQLVLALVSLVGGFLYLVALVLMVTVGLRAASQHYFRAVDGHPCMRAVVSAALSTWTLGTLAWSWAEESGGFALPTWAVVLVLIGGPLVNVALAAYELRRLRVVHGIDFRSAYVRTTPVGV
ncbi:hypothetical protein [Sanguibacter suaedae]|uniref:Uncharacterized protein n=1 Tax=Sanguibacter suaedae TaxID=2795737 RepID=A0A934IF05_9MICO|nr:hypothetical protein [Sanguibacter suaedae]MBI9115734.1 hypothetical protein [Sanguibacter suaedae]